MMDEGYISMCDETSYLQFKAFHLTDEQAEGVFILLHLR